ncbi:hypothetical protein LDENG_00005400, partial [Lucifuga dentata]
MTVSNITCMKIEYIRLKHAKWVVQSFKLVICRVQNSKALQKITFVCRMCDRMLLLWAELCVTCL